MLGELRRHRQQQRPQNRFRQEKPIGRGSNLRTGYLHTQPVCERRKEKPDQEAYQRSRAQPCQAVIERGTKGKPKTGQPDGR